MFSRTAGVFEACLNATHLQPKVLLTQIAFLIHQTMRRGACDRRGSEGGMMAWSSSRSDISDGWRSLIHIRGTPLTLPQREALRLQFAPTN
jgi:hypothetical protein